MERTPPYAAVPRASPYQEQYSQAASSIQVPPPRALDNRAASPTRQYYYSPSPYAPSAASTLHAAPAINVSMSSSGPRMLAPPKAVQSIYATYAPPERPKGEGVEAEKVKAMNIANLKLLEQLDRANVVSKLPPAMYETDTKCFVQGFKKADGTLMVRRRATRKPVHFRECSADASTSDVIVFHVEGASDVVILDTCRRMRVMVDSVVRKAVLIGCHDVEIVIGGIPPQVVLVSSSNCCIATSKDDWLSEIETVGCSGVSVLIAKGEKGEEVMHVKDILHAPDLERVLLPDALLTAVRKGTVATQCHYVDEAAVPPLLAPRGQEAASAIPKAAQEAPEYAAVTHETSDFKVEYVSTICSVGLLLANDHLGTRVTAMERGPALHSGRIKEGDYLMTVDGIDIRGYPVQEIHTLLMGPQGTTTTVGMCRLAADGTLVEGYDVVLTRLPIIKQEQDQLDIPQELPVPGEEYKLREALPYQMRAAAPPPAAMSPTMDMPPGSPPTDTTPWQQPAADPMLTPTQPIESKSWKWTPKVPTPGNLGGIPAAWKDRDLETELVLSQTAKPLPPLQGIIHRSGHTSALNQSSATAVSITSGIGGDGQVRSAGIGMAVQQGAMGLYAVSAVVPGGPADTSGQVKKGDIVHSVNGTVLAGKPPEAFKDLVWGAVGSEVMLALLRPEAQPEDILKELTEFEWWRPVILIRSLRTRPVADGAGMPPPLPADVLVGTVGASVFGSPYRSQNSALQTSQNGALGSTTPIRESFVSAAGRVTLAGPSGKQASPDEGIGVALWLDESMQEVAGTQADEASFRARLTHDLASCLAVRPRQINVAGLQAGSVIAQVELHPCEDGRDDRSPMQLAGELLHQASSQDSRLRAFRSTRRATFAKIMGPLSALRPEVQADPMAMQTLAPSPPQEWQHVPAPKTIWDDPVGMRDAGRGLDLKANKSVRSSAESPYSSRRNLSASAANANGSRSLHMSNVGDVNSSKSFMNTTAEPAGKRLLSGVLAGAEREAGVGLGLGERNGVIEVVSIVPGEAADESGEVFERNLLVSVDDLPLRQMSMEQILSLVNGPSGSKVRLGLIRLAGTPGGMRDQDVMVSVELTRGENERVREQRREKEATEKLRREEWMRAQAERTDQLRQVAQREQERIMLQEQQEMAEMMRAAKEPPPESAVRYTGPSRIVALTRKYDAVRQRVGLGLSLTSVQPSGEILVAGMTEGGAAQESQQIVVGDVVHKVDSVDVKGKSVAEVVELIRGEPGRAVVLLIQGTTLDQKALDPTINSRSMYTSMDLSRSMGGNEMMRVALVRQAASLSAVTPDSQTGQPQGGLGIGLGQTRDGVHFVNGLMKGGSAERSGQVLKGDRIIAIDDMHATGRSVEEVIGLIRGPVGSTAVLTLERGAMLPHSSETPMRLRFDSPQQRNSGPAQSDTDHRRTEYLPDVTPIQARDVESVTEPRFSLEEAPRPTSANEASPRPAFQLEEVPRNGPTVGQPAATIMAEAALPPQAPTPPSSLPPQAPTPPSSLPPQAPTPPSSQPEHAKPAEMAAIQPTADTTARGGIDLPIPAVAQTKRGGIDLAIPAVAQTSEVATRDLQLPAQSTAADADRWPSQQAARDTVQAAQPKSKLQDPDDEAPKSKMDVDERAPIAAPERTPMQGPDQRLEIPAGGYPVRQQTPPTPPQPVPEFHKSPTPPPSHGAGVTTPPAKELPRGTQSYNVRVVSGSEILSASPDPELISSTVACNLKAVDAQTGKVLANLGTVVEGTLDDNGDVMFRGVATDVTVYEDEVPGAELQLAVWDLSAGDRGMLGECTLPLSKLPLGKDLKVNCPIEDPLVLPPAGWVGQASGYVYLRILSKEPDLGWPA